MKRKYGWKPQLPDQRDFLFAAITPARQLPAKVDLRPKMPFVYDQGNLGSCTGNGVAAIHHFSQIVQNKKAFVPSRLQIYYDERSLEGTTRQDSGANIRDGLKCVANKGVCPETMWPYDITKFANRPPRKCYLEAVKHQAIKYMSVVPSLSQLKGCLADGFPFVFGISVYESFESDGVAKTGEVPMPSTTEQMLGGHCIVAVGYDDATQRFIIRNSWGADWGDKGHCYLPYNYVTNRSLASDFWTIRAVE